MMGESEVSFSGALRRVICWQNWPSPKYMRLRRSVRLDGSLMGPASLHTLFGEHAPKPAAAASSTTEGVRAKRMGAGAYILCAASAAPLRRGFVMCSLRSAPPAWPLLQSLRGSAPAEAILRNAPRGGGGRPPPPHHPPPPPARPPRP